MAQQDFSTYTPKLFVQGLSVAKRVVAGDQATGTEYRDYRRLAGDESGVRLLAGDEA